MAEMVNEKKTARSPMTVREAGEKGGKTTRAKYGPEFYQSIGKEGGEETAKRHGPDFYHKIGKKGGQRVRQLIEAGKKREESQ